MSRYRITWLAVLLMVGAAPGDDGQGPLVLPDDRSVELSVEVPRPVVDNHAASAGPTSAKVAPTIESLPLGEPQTPTTPLTSVGAEGDRSIASRLEMLDPRRSEITRIGLALAVVIGLLFLLRSMVRRVGGPLAGGGRPAQVLEVLARYPIARAQHLVLLKLAGRVVLLHQTKTAMTTLSEVSDPDEVAKLLGRVEAATRDGGGRFQSMLAGIGGKARSEASFPPTVEQPDKVVVDLTRRPRRRALPRGTTAS